MELLQDISSRNTKPSVIHSTHITLRTFESMNGLQNNAIIYTEHQLPDASFPLRCLGITSVSQLWRQKFVFTSAILYLWLALIRSSPWIRVNANPRKRANLCCHPLTLRSWVVGKPPLYRYLLELYV